MNTSRLGLRLSELLFNTSSTIRYGITGIALLGIVLLWYHAVYCPFGAFLVSHQKKLSLKQKKKESLLKRLESKSATSESLDSIKREIYKAREKLPKQWKDGAQLFLDTCNKKRLVCVSQKLIKRKDYKCFKLGLNEYAYRLLGTYERVYDLLESLCMHMPHPYCDYFLLERGADNQLICECRFSFLETRAP